MCCGTLTVYYVVQPYRTLPLVQPSAKARTDMGIGSISHLKMQDDHISGDKQPQLAPHSQALAAKAKHDELVMKQKVRRPPLAALGGVDSQGGGEEEGEAMQGGYEGGAVRGREGGGGPRAAPRRRNSAAAASGATAAAAAAAAPSGGKVKDDFMKINKTTFNIGGQIVQLKDPGKGESLEEESNPTVTLRRRSAADSQERDLEKNMDSLRLAQRAEGGRSRSLGYEVTTTRLEELEDNVVLPLPDIPTSKDEQEVEYTFSLRPPPAAREVSSMDVEETVKLVVPRPKAVQPEVQSVNVRETVRIRRTYYIP